MSYTNTRDSSSPFAIAFCCSLLGVDLAGNAGRVLAQQTETVGLEEITVTAQRREERLQDTPISITAFGAAAIAKLGASNVEQLANFAPNVRFDFTAPVSGASDASEIFIRGVGQADFALTTEAGVGTYVDGVYMSRSIGGVLDVLDIDRMEILRDLRGRCSAETPSAARSTSSAPNPPRSSAAPGHWNSAPSIGGTCAGP